MGTIGILETEEYYSDYSKRKAVSKKCHSNVCRYYKHTVDKINDSIPIHYEMSCEAYGEDYQKSGLFKTLKI